MKEIFELLKQVLNREFIRAVLSNPRTKDGVVKAKVRPLEKNGDFMFQVEKFTKTQAFHENINCKDAAEIWQVIWKISGRCRSRLFRRNIRFL